MTRPIYRGFSTERALQTKGMTFTTTNVETVKQDLLNHIWTIPGERVMLPNFGTRIPLLAFEPLDSSTLLIVKEDLTRVFEYDPRVRLIELAVLPLPDNNAILALADILYVEFDVKETLRLEFPVGS